MDSKSPKATDLEVRQLLNAPSLQCLIVRRRLLLVSSILKYAPAHIAILLSARNSSGSPMARVSLVIDDLKTCRIFMLRNWMTLGVLLKIRPNGVTLLFSSLLRLASLSRNLMLWASNVLE